MSVNRRVIGLFLVLLLLGAGAGYAWAASSGESGPSRFSDAAPVPAESPAFPVEPEEPYAEDVDFPELLPGLDYVRDTVGEKPFKYAYSRPDDWVATGIGAGEVTYSPPESVEGDYGMRVKIVNARLTPSEMVAQKLTALEATEDDVEVLGQGTDSLSITYRSGENRLRYNTFRWFSDVGAGFATFETSVFGRQGDVEGLRDLLDKVSASVERITGPV